MIAGYANLMYRQTPEYLRAYEEGYNQAKDEMLEMIEGMQALYTSSTVSATKVTP